MKSSGVQDGGSTSAVRRKIKRRGTTTARVTRREKSAPGLQPAKPLGMEKGAGSWVGHDSCAEINREENDRGTVSIRKTHVIGLIHFKGYPNIERRVKHDGVGEKGPALVNSSLILFVVRQEKKGG